MTEDVVAVAERTIGLITRPDPQPGSGLLHPFPTPELRDIDPYVFLDLGPPEHIGEGSGYVPPHAHRGVQPVGLVFRGRVEHRDSLGNQVTVTSGGMQWLVSGAGALHEETLSGDAQGMLHAAQLWVNLPASLKLAPPEHHALPVEQIPEVTSLGSGSVVRLYAGELESQTGPAPLSTPVLLAHLTLDPDGQVTIPVPVGWTAAATAVAGQPQVAGHALAAGHTVVFNDDGHTVSFDAPSGGQLLLMCGQPIGEPIAMGGGFVMNTKAEITQAFEDEQAGLMGELNASR